MAFALDHTLFLVAAVGLWGGLLAFSPDPSQRRGASLGPCPQNQWLGRVAPEGRLLDSPADSNGALAGARVEKLLVDVGDEIKAGQVVALLDTIGVRAAAVIEAKAKSRGGQGENSPR